MIDWHARVKARLASQPKKPALKVVTVNGKVVPVTNTPIPKKPKF